MKANLSILLLLLFFNVGYSQQLVSILDGYSVSSIPTSKSIVGAKWSSDFGATTEGLPESELLISHSFNQLAIDKASEGNLKFALLSALGLSGFSTNEIDVIFDKLEVYTVKNLYNLPLVKGEKIVFSSLKAASFALEYSENLASHINAKLTSNKLSASGEVDFGSKKRITVNGSNLFIAHKVVSVKKTKTSTKTRKFKANKFKINNLLDYSVEFDVNQLVNKSMDATIEEIGIDAVIGLGSLDRYIMKYSNASPIKVDIFSTSRGTLSGDGILSKTFDLCYCELIGSKKRLYPINFVNSGEKVTFEYLYIDAFSIQYNVIPATNRDGMPVGFLSTTPGSKISVITKTYYLSQSN